MAAKRKRAKKSARTSSGNRVPLKVLESRALYLAQLVARRGGKVRASTKLTHDNKLLAALRETRKTNTVLRKKASTIRKEREQAKKALMMMAVVKRKKAAKKPKKQYTKAELMRRHMRGMRAGGWIYKKDGTAARAKRKK